MKKTKLYRKGGASSTFPRGAEPPSVSEQVLVEMDQFAALQVELAQETLLAEDGGAPESQSASDH